MKREEAIKLIDTHTVCFYNEIDSPTLQALHLAIDALSVIDIVDLTNGNTITKAEYDGEPSDLISRADALQCNPEFLNPNPNDKPNNYPIGWNDAIKVWYADIKLLPSAETHEIRTETHGVCLISKDDAMGAVQDHFNDNGFKGYDDGQKMMDRINALPSAEQVTSKLKNPCDSLLTEDSAECKEQKSKLEHDRDWIIGCIKHDGFIKTDRFDKANQIILDALADRPSGEWLWRGFNIECSLCGDMPTFDSTEDLPNYCPSCGAFMKGGAE